MQNSFTRIILFIFLFSSLVTSAQEKRISLEFQNASLTDVISRIENASGFTFMFDKSWLDEEKKLFSASFAMKPVKEILSEVLSETELNYFFYDGKIILTKNVIIRDTFDDPAQITEPSGTAATEEGLVLIGRQTINDTNTTFTVSGQIKDLKTEEPLPGALVSIKELNLNSVTDANGFFSLKVPKGRHTISVAAQNYQTSSTAVMVYGSGKRDFAIAESINTIAEVVVSSQQSATRTTAIGVTSITPEAVKTVPVVLGERDIFKVATILPGVKTTGEGSAGLNVRGGKEDQNLILLDDAVLYNPFHFLGFFSAVNPFMTSRADIYKGSIPAQFGGRLSSVFDIQSKNSNTNKFSGEGGIGPVTSNLMLDIPVVKGKSGLVVGGRATYSGWILRSLDQEELKNSEASFYDVSARYNHNFSEKNALEATVYYSSDKFRLSSDSLYNYSNKLASLKWNHRFNEKVHSAVIFTGSEYKFGIDDQGSNPFEFGYSIRETQGIFRTGHELSERHTLNYGLSSKLYSIDPGFLHPANQSTRLPIDLQQEKGLESAIYLSDDFKITDKLLLNAGLRFSHYAALGPTAQRVYEPNAPLSDETVVEVRDFSNNEVIRSYSGLEPRIAARYLFNDDFSVKAGYDKTFQYIHLLSSHTTQSPTDTWKLSDLNIEPQESQQYSLGFYKNFSNRLYEISVEGYYKRSKNTLDYKVGSDILLNENIETELLKGEGKAYGVELLIKKTSGRLNGWLGYTYSRSFVRLNSQFDEERVNSGNYFPANFDKPHDVSAVLNYKFTKRYSASANVVYQTGRPITYPIGTYTYGNAEYTMYSDRNQFRIPDYFRVDIGINIEGNHRIKKLAHSFWNISVYNVLGRNNPYSIFFVSNNGEVKGYKTSIFSIPVPTITYNFQF